MLKEGDLADKAVRGHSIASKKSLTLLLEVRFKSLLFYLSSIIVFIVAFPVVMINDHC